MSMLAEIQAMCDVLDQITVRTESMSVEEALEARDGIAILKSSVARMSKAIEKMLLERLEQPKQVGDRIIAVKPKGKWRTNHAQVRTLICHRACVDLDTGQIFNAQDAVQRAVDLVYRAYVTRSDVPTMAFLREFGFKTKQEVSFWEETGTELVETKGHL